MLRLILIFTMLAAALPARAQGDKQPARRAVALLDYVTGDYFRAVGPHGELLSAAEHEEQIGFVEDAARELRADTHDEALAKRVDALAQEVAAKKPPAEVVRDARAVREEIARKYNVVLLPSHAPDLQHGAALYKATCAACHGAEGHPNLALGLATTPRDFATQSEMKTLSPQRAFSAITYGVPNTPMPSWDEAFDDQARWDLAFYVFTLSKPAPTPDGEQLARAALLPTAYADLAALSDEQLEERLAAAGLSPEQQTQALAAVRAGPFKEPVAAGPQGLAQARRAVQKAVATARGGDRAAARSELVAAYLDHFEPHEAKIRARDGALVTQIEGAFLALRTDFDKNTPPEDDAAKLDALLEKADQHPQGGGFISFIAALAIALREGVEAALLVAAMLAFLRKANRERDAHAVHAGWMLALGAGAVTWWASGALLVHLSGAQREWVEGVLQLVTAALLLYASHWLLAAISAKRLVSFLSARTLAAGSAAVVCGLTFIAVFREMFEVVLFFRGLLLESPGEGAQIALGAATGLVALAALVVLFQRVGKKLKPRPLLVTCGVMLCALAVMMVGNGIRSLQVLGAIPLTVWGAFELPRLGVYATREGLLAQALVLVALIVSALWTGRERKNGDGHKRDTAPAPAAS